MHLFEVVPGAVLMVESSRMRDEMMCEMGQTMGSPQIQQYRAQVPTQPYSFLLFERMID